jgi:predicted hydrocarbon binding protein
MPLPDFDRSPPRENALAPSCLVGGTVLFLSVHGLIFSSLRDYVGVVGGAETVDRVFRDEIYLSSGAYDDQHFFSLLSRACEETGAERDEFLHDFGVYTAERTFKSLYPEFFSLAGSTRDFLLTIEKRIHELVRATMPNARPPRLTISELGEHGVSVTYSSPRKLCVLLRGLAQGVALHYEEPATIEEKTCMLKGDEACTFEVLLSGEAKSA